MAGNYITIGSKFKPFSYAEMIQPVAMATEAHQQVEEQYANLSTQASQWEEKANEQTDPHAYKMYKTYANDLNNQANILAKEGLTPISRKSMFSMRDRYAKEILPINEAWEKRKTEAARQQDLRDKDSSIIFNRTAAVTSLDEYLKNPNLSHQALSVNEVHAMASRDFAEAAKKVQKEGDWKTTLGGQYWEKNTRIGYTPQEINAVIAGDPNAPKELKSLYDSITNSYLSRGEWDQQGKQSIIDAVNRAASYGIGTLNPSMQANRAYESPADRQTRLARQASLSAPSDRPTLTHLEGSLDTGGKDFSRYNDAMKKFIATGGKGLSSNYFGKKGFVNPMKIYEEAVQYAKKHPSTSTTYAKPSGDSPPVPLKTDNSLNNALNVIARKYNVDKPISSDDYKTLKELGFSSQSTFNDMNGTKLIDAKDKLAQVYRPTSTNLSDYDNVSKRIIPTLNAWENEDSFKAYAYEGGIKGKELSYKNVIKEGSKINDIAYSMRSPENILINIDGKRVFVSPAAISAEANNIVQYYAEQIKRSTTNEQKSYWQDAATDDLMNHLNSYNKIRSNTDSKL